MANTTREQRKEEALKRMKMLDLWEEAVEVFEKEDKVCYSEPTSMGSIKFGAVFLLDGDMPERVKAFEKQFNATVYHVIHNYTEFGEWLTFLFVSDYTEEWKRDREDLKEGYPLAYVDTGDFCSEFGSVGIQKAAGGLLRTA